MIRYPLFGALAQLVAHNTGSVGVRSSNLLCSTPLEALKASRVFFCEKRLSVKKVLSEIMVDFPDKICYYAGDIHEK